MHTENSRVIYILCDTAEDNKVAFRESEFCLQHCSFCSTLLFLILCQKYLQFLMVSHIFDVSPDPREPTSVITQRTTNSLAAWMHAIREHLNASTSRNTGEKDASVESSYVCLACQVSRCDPYTSEVQKCSFLDFANYFL